MGSFEVQWEIYSTNRKNIAVPCADAEISGIISLSFLVTSLYYGIIYFTECAVRKRDRKGSQFMWNRKFPSRLMVYGSALSVSTMAS
jgi:hypothetical protein